MNYLYKVTREVYYNDILIHKFSGEYAYGEKFNQVMHYTKDEFLFKYNQSFSQKKIHIYGYNEIHESVNKFRDAYLKITYTIIDANDCTLDTLMTKLPALDFIEFMKDHGMSVCPMK